MFKGAPEHETSINFILDLHHFFNIVKFNHAKRAKPDWCKQQALCDVSGDVLGVFLQSVFLFFFWIKLRNKVTIEGI